ncbi:hypothetical protein ACHAXS_012883, partial [Conticribra weissflogii]
RISPPWYRSNFLSRILISSLKRDNRSTASIGAIPFTSGPLLMKSPRNLGQG